MSVTLPLTVVQGTIATNGDAVSITNAGGGVLGVQIAGTWTGTISFTACLDGTNYVTFTLNPYPSGAGVTSATANGVWTATFSGFVFFKATATAAITGSATVTLNVSKS